MDDTTITRADAPPPHEPPRDQFPLDPTPSRYGGLLRRTAPLLAAALVGGGIAAGVAVAVGDDDQSAPVAAEAAPAAAPAPADPIADDDEDILPAPVETALDETPSGELTVQAIYKNAGPGVVAIQATSEVASEDPFGFGGSQTRQALGSGFVIDKAGHIVTNYHVVEGATEVEVVFSDNEEAVTARVLGSDASTDLAVLKVDVDANALTPLPLGDSDEVEVGDTAIAIGNPFGLERTVTRGIVSAVQREIQAPDGFAIDHVIQTDAAINRGNSGGPLLNGRGEVIGVNSQIQTGGLSDGNVGIGFAVPVNTVKDVANQIIEDGTVERAYLGVTLSPITDDLRDTVRIPVDSGVLVSVVTPDGPAARAGLRGGDRSVTINGQTYVIGGDIITAVDGEPVETSDEIVALIRDRAPGDSVTLEINRDGSTQTLTVELGRRPVPNG
ncbi:MAG: trypsin-like peptidase domain-containing protein [Thermoleophilia bacterium]